jgi:GT2 family glycosyltransferase
MIHTMVPFAPDMNLGAAYNRAMSLIHEDDWACFCDHDMMFTTRYWHAQLMAAVRLRPHGTFTAITNRIASPWQRAQETDPKNNDVGYHRLIGANRYRSTFTLLDISGTKGFGGVMMLLSKKNWLRTKGFADGMGCVDHSMFFQLQDLGLKSYLMEDLYVYHFRGTCGTPREADIPKVPNCRCRGPEELPTERYRYRVL